MHGGASESFTEGRMTKIACDWCRKVDVCRFEWLRDSDDLPMLFCAIRCMENYIMWHATERFDVRLAAAKRNETKH